MLLGIWSQWIVASGKLDPARLPNSDNKAQWYILLERQSLSLLRAHSTVVMWVHIDPLNRWPRTKTIIDNSGWTRKNGSSISLLYHTHLRKWQFCQLTLRVTFKKCKYILILISFMVILHTTSKNCYIKLFKIKGILELLMAP